MLISKYVEMKLGEKNFTFLKKKYYLDNSLIAGDIVFIPISLLSKSSHFIVDVSCDYCSDLLKVPYRRYIKSIKDVDKISCNNKECSNQKIKDVCQYKYGVDNPFQLQDVKDKTKNTLIEKYGVEHPMYLQSTKDKIKLTSYEKYGYDSYTKTEEFKSKTKNTCFERYGVEYYLQVNEFREKGKLTSISKYGVDHYSKTDEYSKRIKKTYLRKLGVEHNMYTQETKDKIKETCLERYGVENVFKSEIIKNKIRETCFKRYGVYNYTHTNEYRIKTENTCIAKYNTDSYTKSEEHHINTIIGSDINYINYIGNSISLFKCDKEHTFEITTDLYFNRIRYNTPLCTVCHPIGEQKSIKENELLEYIKSIYSGEIINGYRDVLEIDIYLPGLNLGFEFNGLYWHSEKFKETNYHLNKTNYFKDKGIRIIHIWEDDYNNKLEIIKSQINNLLCLNYEKIFARKCVIKIIVDSRISTKFLNDNHIQGKVNSSLKIGLYHQEELLSIMNFDNFEGRKKMEEGGYNLSRFCNKINTNVVGGASKLLNHFIKNYDVKRIVSYADKDWSIGSLYYTLGFENISESKPDYKYVVNNQRVHKSRYKKSKLNTDLTESQEMKKRDIYKVYDCGKIKFEYKKIPL